ncbi:MAG: hypothetical protein HFJ84_09320 [Clostridiales bacterium]|nr:hypothetical protein [Clostridiales bacterium]
MEASNPNVAAVTLVDTADSRGAKYQVNAKAAGTTEMKELVASGKLVVQDSRIGSIDRLGSPLYRVFPSDWKE